jgi:sec-independent protein translocase protein TatA
MVPSVSHILLVLLLVLILFGAGKLPRVMGDVGKGIRNLRKELQGGDEDEETPSLASVREKADGKGKKAEG